MSVKSDWGLSRNRAVDVIIPYYSSIEYVPACIDSILWQKDVQTVIHLVNDCSPEDDRMLIDKYGSLENIRWYRTRKNVGPYQICNALIAEMETDYFALMGSDDLSLPSRLKISIDTMLAERTEVFFATMENFLSPEKQYTSHDVDYVSEKPFYVSSMNGVLVNGTMVISRSTFEYVNGFENVFCGGDTEFAERLKKSGVKISISPQCVALRRIHGRNLSRYDGTHGLHSPERKKIAREWDARFKLWRHDFDRKQYGGLGKVGDILETRIGKSTKVWSTVNLCDGATIGKDCVLGQGVYVGGRAVIGDRARVQNSVFIPDGVTIGDDVFIGPNCTFTNDKYPPSRGKHWQFTRVSNGASIGAASVILPGITIGSNSVIGAGSVVTKDVRDNSTGWGNPYREKTRIDVNVGLATFPPRFHALLETIESLHDQVDHIHICLNEYKEIPGELQRFPKVNCTIPDIDLSDLGKFLQLPNVKGYFFTCDDDLIYPEDYVSSTITQLRKYGGAVSYLGRVLPSGRKCTSYYRDTAEYYHCLKEVKEDHRVHVVGTGVMCFHTDSIDFRYGDHKESGMADIQFGIYAARNAIQLTALKHPKDWIKHTAKIDLSETIYSRNKDNDSLYTDAINQIDWSEICVTP